MDEEQDNKFWLTFLTTLLEQALDPAFIKKRTREIKRSGGGFRTRLSSLLDLVIEEKENVKEEKHLKLLLEEFIRVYTKIAEGRQND